MRKDISEWLIHFVHRRNPTNDPHQRFEEFVHVPIAYGPNREPIITDWEYYEQEYPIAIDDYPFAVLKKIFDDGYIQATWAFRNQKPTVYGPRAAVCFTEMPLSALIEYARARADEESVHTYGIALPKVDLFAAGARPVIYGLSTQHKEADKDDPYSHLRGRILAASCGIAPQEQFRYVTMRLDGEKVIDWSHEREWRWTKNFKGGADIPGLSLWLADENHGFSQILILVQTAEEAKRFLDRLQTRYDNPYNDYDQQFSQTAILRTRVIALDEISMYLKLDATLRLDDLPSSSLKTFSRPTPPPAMLDKVRAAVTKARAAAKMAEAANPANGLFGFSWVSTYDAQTDITQALLDLGYATSTGGRGYRVGEVMKDVRSDMIDTLEAAAEAAASVLSSELGQEFFMESRLD